MATLDKPTILKGLIATYSADSLNQSSLQKDFDNFLEKGKGAEIGEIRTWGGEQYVKHFDGWVHVHKKTGKVSVLPTSGPVRKLDGTDEHRAHYGKHVVTKTATDSKDQAQKIKDDAASVHLRKDEQLPKSTPGNDSLKNLDVASEFPVGSRVKAMDPFGAGNDVSGTVNGYTHHEDKKNGYVHILGDDGKEHKKVWSVLKKEDFSKLSDDELKSKYDEFLDKYKRAIDTNDPLKKNHGINFRRVIEESKKRLSAKNKTENKNSLFNGSKIDPDLMVMMRDAH